jgi:hypothetical protein
MDPVDPDILVWFAVRDALLATNAFDPDGVFLWAPEDQGQGTDITAAAWIEQIGGQDRDEFDAQPAGALNETTQLKITFAFRADDPTERDMGAKNLLNVAKKALNGQVLLAGFTIPGWTRFLNWSWSKPGAPERQIVCIFQYQSETEGWNAFETTEQ